MTAHSHLSEHQWDTPMIQVQHLTAAYGDYLIFDDISFDLPRGKVSIILGGSGCGKSTLLKHLIGLIEPKKGHIIIDQQPITGISFAQKTHIMHKFGVLYQSGALFSSMTVGENVDLVLREFTTYTPKERKAIIHDKLAWVGMEKYVDFMPSELSGGMRKRAGLARAMALNPPLLFFDEPSAGLDPISSAQLDMLILNLKEKFQTTIVIVTHELESIFTIGDYAIMLDKNAKNIIARGAPHHLRETSTDPRVRAFLTRDGLIQTIKN